MSSKFPVYAHTTVKTLAMSVSETLASRILISTGKKPIEVHKQTLETFIQDPNTLTIFAFVLDNKLLVTTTPPVDDEKSIKSI